MLFVLGLSAKHRRGVEIDYYLTAHLPLLVYETNEWMKEQTAYGNATSIDNASNGA